MKARNPRALKNYSKFEKIFQNLNVDLQGMFDCGFCQDQLYSWLRDSDILYFDDDKFQIKIPKNMYENLTSTTDGYFMDNDGCTTIKAKIEIGYQFVTISF